MAALWFSFYVVNMLPQHEDMEFKNILHFKQSTANTGKVFQMQIILFNRFYGYLFE